jgi:phosphatidylglycerol:prolipoprotein diacylglycerol transferase
VKDGFKGTKSPLNLPTESPAVYPNLYFLFQDLFGVEISALKLVNSFGLLVALAFVAGSGLLRRELQRKEKEGALDPTEKQVWVGKPEGPLSWASSGLLGFLLGWKVLWLLWNASDLFTGVAPPQRHLFSGEGYPLLGLAVAALMAWLRWKEDVKQRLDQPEQRKLKVHPWERTGNITLVAAVGGVTGAKLFHLLEYPDEFVAFFQAPSLQAFIGGLTIYGGLIVGGLAVAAYARRHRMPFLHLADATAPGLMLAYGIGRLGCQISGDGDWGIPNPAPKPNWLSWAPDWVWSYPFPNNVNAVYGPRPAGYTGKLITESDPWPIFEGFGTYLDPGVFPTSFYETIMAVGIFALLWTIRKRLKTPGLLFSIYLMFNGVERFFIEKIRVNAEMDFLGVTLTQAELISTCTFFGGVALAVFVLRRSKRA